MEVSGHRHALVALTPIPNKQEAERAPQQVQVLCKEGEFLVSGRT